MAASIGNKGCKAFFRNTFLFVLAPIISLLGPESAHAAKVKAFYGQAVVMGRPGDLQVSQFLTSGWFISLICMAIALAVVGFMARHVKLTLFSGLSAFFGILLRLYADDIYQFGRDGTFNWTFVVGLVVSLLLGIRLILFICSFCWDKEGREDRDDFKDSPSLSRASAGVGSSNFLSFRDPPEDKKKKKKREEEESKGKVNYNTSSFDSASSSAGGSVKLNRPF